MMAVAHVLFLIIDNFIISFKKKLQNMKTGTIRLL